MPFTATLYGAKTVSRIRPKTASDFSAWFAILCLLQPRARRQYTI